MGKEQGFLISLRSKLGATIAFPAIAALVALFMGAPFLTGMVGLQACDVACYTDSDCDDGVIATVDVCNNDGECSAACQNVPTCDIACAKDSDCDDSSPETVDVCSNDGTCESNCSNVAAPGECTIACSSDADCDDANSATADVCSNEGTCEAECAHLPEEAIVEPPIVIGEGQPVVYYTFDVADQNKYRAADSSGNRKHAQHINPVPTEGILGTSAVYFDGNQAEPISLPIESSISNKPEWGVSFWFKTDSSSRDSFWMESYSDRSFANIYFDPEWGISPEYYNASTKQSSWIACENIGQGCNTGYNDGEWHHLAWTRSSANSWEFYLDGKLAGTDNTNIPLLEGQPRFIHIGHGLSGYITASIDEFKAFDRALSAKEVSELFKEGLAGPKAIEGGETE